MQRFLSAAALAAAIAAPLSAQLPDGYFAWCSFQGRAGQTGVFFSHPRTPDAPLQVTGLSPDLAYVPGGRQGASCIAYRRGDGALLVGERAPAGHSVDMHVILVDGTAVRFAQLFSMGTSGGVGEIPQLALLPDGRVLVAATDLSSGPLAYLQTQSYGLEGIGIVDTVSGTITPVPISNPGAVSGGVFNGLTVSPDGTTAYIANYVSSTQGDVLALPLPGGGALSMVTSVPAGVSNVTVDSDGDLLICALNGPPNLWRHEFSSGNLHSIATNTGPLNAIAVEEVSGNYAVISANSGTPDRSVFWLEPNGQEHLLVSPNFATISGVAINPNPETFGGGTPGINSYAWELAPNAGGLPLVGNQGFSLSVETKPGTATYPSFAVFATQRLEAAVRISGVDIWVDPASIAADFAIAPRPSTTIPLAIPNHRSLVGLELYAQTIHLEPTALAASDLLGFTIL